MNREMLTVKGLKGDYTLYIDGERIGTWSVQPGPAADGSGPERPDRCAADRAGRGDQRG